MAQSTPLKLFVSYSHRDETHANDFISHIAPLKSNGLVEEWYDRKITAGQSLSESIDNNLENADMICLLISAHFLSSLACMGEVETALRLKKEKGTAVLPIILSPCGWLDCTSIASLLALPTDGKPVTSFADANSAWNSVYAGLRKALENESTIRNITLSEEFVEFLQDAELLSKAHSQKDRVLLNDIFVFPELDKYDEFREYEECVSSERLLETFTEYSKILIAGESQAGKTTLCKVIFSELRKTHFVPVYVADPTNQFKGKIDNRISKAFSEQYESVSFEDIDKTRVVPIIDDFHGAKNMERHIRDLSQYQHKVVTVDDIFSLNFKDENLIRSFSHFRMKEFRPSLRDQLIRKWTSITDDSGFPDTGQNTTYQLIDSATEFVNTALGKVIGSGIMPAFPFFILTVVSTSETFENRLTKRLLLKATVIKR
jgi:TIR domain